MITILSRSGWPTLQHENSGFSIVELLLALAILPLMVLGISNAYNSIRHSYTLARQLNEMYAVLSACPELDRALEFNSLNNSANCYPNNSFAAEDGYTGTISYAPSLTVTDTASLAGTDPLQAVPDSKVVSISVAYPAPNGSRPPLQLRMLITRNGIGQE
jgi:prepilin-type N-terminal cleavage/methylation domain-containing protein